MKQPKQLRLFNEQRDHILNSIEDWNPHDEDTVEYRQAQLKKLAKVREETGV